uniref:Uncharacterized protein n=1 Tax=Anguilla anguilla TaxID=7936 RepID=A0A0E9T531_ANGAN
MWICLSITLSSTPLNTNF